MRNTTNAKHYDGIEKVCEKNYQSPLGMVLHKRARKSRTLKKSIIIFSIIAKKNNLQLVKAVFRFFNLGQIPYKNMLVREQVTFF